MLKITNYGDEKYRTESYILFYLILLDGLFLPLLEIGVLIYGAFHTSNLWDFILYPPFLLFLAAHCVFLIPTIYLVIRFQKRTGKLEPTTEAGFSDDIG